MHRAGSFSFPNVPPNAELEYDLELVDFEAVNEVCTSPPPCPSWHCAVSFCWHDCMDTVPALNLALHMQWYDTLAPPKRSRSKSIKIIIWVKTANS